MAGYGWNPKKGKAHGSNLRWDNDVSNRRVLIKMDKRGGGVLNKIRQVFFCLFLSVGGWGSFAIAASVDERVVISLPGPRSISYLPIELIGKIGADRAEGIHVGLRHFGGGGLAMQDLMKRNSEFAVLGLPAVMSQYANGGDVAAVAAVNDLPLYMLMVRADLKGQVKKIADLRGRVIGVYSSSLSSKTASQQLMELVLKSAGVSLDEVRFISIGQSWQGISTMFQSGAVDAVMGGEPFASRLRNEKQVFFLLDLSKPSDASSVPGVGFLRATLVTRGETVRNFPQRVEKMVRALRRSLHWMSTHTPEAIVEKLDIQNGEERLSLLNALKSYPRLYSPDGRFSSAQMRETQHFFRKSSGDNPAAMELDVESLIVDHWAGRKE